MKKLWMVVSFLLLLGCGEEEGASPTVPIDDNFDTSKATLLKTGVLEGAAGHTASGVASVYDSNGTLVVVLDPYSSQNGPDLKVYLSKDVDASEYIRLGNLKSTMGKQAYEVPGMPDVGQYHYVHVWCERYTVVFARAEVK